MSSSIEESHMQHDMLINLCAGRKRLRHVVATIGLSATLLLPGVVASASLQDFTNQESATALREALVVGARRAVETLGRTNGYLGDPQVKIPLPSKFARVERALRTVGMGKQVDNLVTTMNRAAEAAVPEATSLLVDSARKMSVQDAKDILTGGDDAATLYFKRTTSDKLAERFLPIVKRATAQAKVAESYNKFAGSAASFGLIDKKNADLDGYITQKALDGLFLKMAEEEKAIRKDPVRAGTDIVKRVFGAMRLQ